MIGKGSVLRVEGEIIYVYAMIGYRNSYQVLEMKNEVKDSKFKFKVIFFFFYDRIDVEKIKDIRLVGSRQVRTSENNGKYRIFVTDLKIEDGFLTETTGYHTDDTVINITSFIDNSNLSIDIIPD